METYPRNPNSIRFVLIAPMLKSIGIAHLSSEIFLSERIICVTPCLTDSSQFFFKLFIASSNVSFKSKVQSKIL